MSGKGDGVSGVVKCTPLHHSFGAKYLSTVSQPIGSISKRATGI